MAMCNRDGNVYKRHIFSRLAGPKGNRFRTKLNVCIRCHKLKVNNTRNDDMAALGAKVRNKIIGGEMSITGRLK